MLYYSNIKFGATQEYPVVLVAKLNVNGNPVRLTFEKIMSNLQYLGAVRENGLDAKINAPADVDPSSALPFLSFSTSTGQERDFTFLYVWLTNNNILDVESPVLPGLLEKLKGNFPDIVMDDLKAFIVGINTLLAYQKGELRFHVVDSGTNFIDAARTLPIVKNFNKSQGHLFEHIKDETNVTAFMQRPDDRFFIHIPEHNKLIFPDPGTDVDNLVPLYEDIVRPYPHPIYQTPYYSSISKLSEPQLMDRLKVIAVQRNIKVETLKPVPEVESGLVKGYAENDTMEIQENELDYYNALMEYIKYDISRTFKDADVEEMFSQSKCSPNMLSYLRELVNAALAINWMHTNKVPLNIAQWYYGNDSDEEEEDEETSYWHDFDAIVSEDMKVRTADGREISVGKGIMRQFIDGTVALFNFIEAAASDSKLGLEAYVQAIIKLFRWGYNKPQALKLGNYDKYFDMNEFKIKSTLGDLSSLQPISTENGFEMAAKGYIKLPGKLDDQELLRKYNHPDMELKIPVGLICERPLMGGKSQIVFVSFFDVLNRYRANPDDKFIEGVTFVGGKFEVAQNLVDFTEHGSILTIQDLVKESTNRELVFYDSDVIKKILLRFSEGPLSSLMVLAEIVSSPSLVSKYAAAMSFKTEEEMYNKMMSTPASKSMYLKIGMGAVYLPVIITADQLARKYLSAGEVGQAQFTLVLNAYLAAATQLGFIDEEHQWSDESNQPVSQQPVVQQSAPAAEQGISRMNTFGGAATTTITVPTTQQVVQESPVSTPLTLADVKPFMRDYFIRPIEKDKIAFQIAVDNNIHGYVQQVVIEGKQRIVLASKSDIPDDIAAINPNIQTISIVFVYQLLASALAALLEPADRGTFLYFNSENTAIYFRQYFSSVWKALSSGGGQ